MDIISTFQIQNFMPSFFNSMIIALLTGGFSLLLGTIQAFLFQRTKKGRFYFFSLLTLVPFFIPAYIHTIAWTRLLAPTGSLSTLLPQHITIACNDFLFSIPGVVFILTVNLTPLVTVIISSGLSLSEKSGEEAALLIHSPLSVFTSLTLPTLFPYLTGSFLLVTIIAMMDFSVPDMLRVRVLPLEIFIQLSVFYNYSRAILLSLPLLGSATILILICQYVMSNRLFVNIPTKSHSTPIHFISSKFIIISGWLFLLPVTFISVFMPLYYLINTVPKANTAFSILQNSFTEIIYSVQIAAGSSCLVLLVALPAAYYLSRHSKLYTLINLSALLPLAIPGSLLALSLLTVNRLPVLHNLSSTSLLCLTGLAVHSLPFGVKILEAEFSRIDQRLEEIAQLTCGNRLQRFKHILFPLLLPGITIAFLFIFILSLGNLSISLLLVPPGHETLPVKIYNLMHYGADEMVAVLCLFLVAIMMTTCFILRLWYKKNQTRLSNLKT